MFVKDSSNYNSKNKYFFELFKRADGFKKPKYFKKLVEKGKIIFSGDGEKLSLEDLPKLTPIIRALQEIFPDNWCFHFSQPYRFKGFVAYVPKLEVTNTEKPEFKHPIYDCFFIIELQKETNRFYISTFNFARTTFQLKEFRSTNLDSGMYVTSHLNTSVESTFQGYNFRNSMNACYGNFSEIAMLPSAVTFEDFVYTFLNMIQYVSVESERGGPYYRIENLNSSTFYQTPVVEESRRIRLALYHFKNFCTQDPENAKRHLQRLDWYYKRTWKVKPNQKFVHFLSGLVRDEIEDFMVNSAGFTESQVEASKNIATAIRKPTVSSLYPATINSVNNYSWSFHLGNRAFRIKILPEPVSTNVQYEESYKFCPKTVLKIKEKIDYAVQQFQTSSEVITFRKQDSFIPF